MAVVCASRGTYMRMQGQYDLLFSSTSDLLLQLINILNQLLPAALQSVGMILSTCQKQACIRLRNGADWMSI